MREISYTLPTDVLENVALIYIVQLMFQSHRCGSVDFANIFGIQWNVWNTKYCLSVVLNVAFFPYWLPNYRLNQFFIDQQCL